MTNEEYEILMKYDKTFIDNSIIKIPNLGKKISRILKSEESSDEFILNIDRGRIELEKIKYLSRHSTTNTILLRLDTHGPRHINPDGEFIPTPHLHRYVEGYGDKWTEPLDKNYFGDITDLADLLKKFLELLNVVNIPDILYVKSLI